MLVDDGYVERGSKIIHLYGNKIQVVHDYVWWDGDTVFEEKPKRCFLKFSEDRKHFYSHLICPDKDNPEWYCLELDRQLKDCFVKSNLQKYVIIFDIIEKWLQGEDITDDDMENLLQYNLSIIDDKYLEGAQ